MRWIDEHCFPVTRQVKFKILRSSLFVINYERDDCVRHGSCCTT